MSKAKSERSLNEKLPFEKALERLEEIARRLEEEELPLETSLQLFEEGVGLSRECGRRLEEAERKVETLARQPDGSLREEPVDLDEDPP